MHRRVVAATAFALALSLPFAALAHDATLELGDDAQRTLAAQRVGWDGAAIPPGAAVPVKILAINDFHGQLPAGKKVSGKDVGSAGVLVAYLRAAEQGVDDRTIVVHAGDHVGASPPASALLQDEPAVSLMNLLANEHCVAGQEDPRCNVVATVGNHEFDEGLAELRRLLDGGTYASGPFLEDPWGGARYPTVCANVVDAVTNLPVFPPYEVTVVDGVSVGFVGAVLAGTPGIVTPAGVAGLRFLDEADAINAAVAELARRQVHAIVVLLHQGGSQSAAGITGDIVQIVSRLDPEVDVVVSGHSHTFLNGLLPNAAGAPVLVTQAYSAGTAYADIDLVVDRRTGDVASKEARIATTWADGVAPDPEAAALQAAAEAKVAPLVNRHVGYASRDLLRTENTAGESTLGNLIADTQRAAMETDFAFMNPGGIRDDIRAGEVTWGALFNVQPFANDLVRVQLTGDQIRRLLEQQWVGQTYPKLLKTSGLEYTWDAAQPVGRRGVAISRGGVPLDPAATYSVTVNSFLRTGGDAFTVLAEGTGAVVGPVDLEALVAWVAKLPQPFDAPALGRVQRLH